MLLLELIRRFVRSDVPACIQQASLSVTVCHALLGIFPVADRMEVLEDFYLHTKTKQSHYLGTICSTKNENIGLIKPKPGKGYLSFIGHLLGAWPCVRF